jgi:hypothetical protein
MTSAIMPISRAVQDTVAYVPRPGGPVDTSAYMWAGYGIVWLTLAVYLLLLFRRIARVRASAARTETGIPR